MGSRKVFRKGGRGSRKKILDRPSGCLASDLVWLAGPDQRGQQVHHMAEDLVVHVVRFLPGHGFVSMVQESGKGATLFRVQAVHAPRFEAVQELVEVVAAAAAQRQTRQASSVR